MTAMADRWYKLRKIPQRKKQALRSVCVGFAFFGLLYWIGMQGWVLCPIRAWFDFSCPGCGMTRAFTAILRGDLLAAFRYNIMSVPLFVGIALYGVFSITDILFQGNFIWKIENQLSKKYMFLVYIPLLVIVTILNNI